MFVTYDLIFKDHVRRAKNKWKKKNNTNKHEENNCSKKKKLFPIKYFCVFTVSC